MIKHVEQEQKEYTRYIIADEYGCVILNLYHEPHKYGNKVYTARIWGLYVIPKHRQKGHSKPLLKEAERIALENGHKDVYLECKENTNGIFDFFIRNGYKPIYGEVVLCKKLTNND